MQRPVEWSGRTWEGGDQIAVSWWDCARLHASLAEIDRLVLPEVVGWDLVPLPPLDGSWIVSRFLPPEPRANYENLRRYGMLMVFGFILMINMTPLGRVFESALGFVMSPYISLAQAIADLGA